MKKRYGALDGLRALAAIGILMMHVGANSNYQISGFLYKRIILSFTDFVFLFFVISAFGMCCGYFDRVINNKIAFSDFYGKRFKKILPFFGVLVLLDLIMSPSVNSLYEGFADLTLLFGFLPNAGNISVIGVGWFIGVVFVFYICFPFFCCLLENKRRAWFAFAISLIYNFVCAQYFDAGRNNILYSACFFLAGGLCFLYSKEIEKINRWIIYIITVLSILSYYIVGANTICRLLVSTSLLVLAMKASGGILENRVTKFLSGISMEIFLSHMVIFRIAEKLKLTTIIGNGWLQYCVSVILVLCGAIVFSVILKWIIAKGEETVRRITKKTI